MLNVKRTKILHLSALLFKTHLQGRQQRLSKRLVDKASRHNLNLGNFFHVLNFYIFINNITHIPPLSYRKQQTLIISKQTQRQAFMIFFRQEKRFFISHSFFVYF